MVDSSRFGGSLDDVSLSPRRRRLEEKRTTERRRHESVELPLVKKKTSSMHRTSSVADCLNHTGAGSLYGSTSSQHNRNTDYLNQAGESLSSVSNKNSDWISQRRTGSVHPPASTSDRNSDYLNQAATSIYSSEPVSKRNSNQFADIRSVSDSSNTTMTDEQRTHPVAVETADAKAHVDIKAGRKLSPKGKLHKLFRILRRGSKSFGAVVVVVVERNNAWRKIFLCVGSGFNIYWVDHL